MVSHTTIDANAIIIKHYKKRKDIKKVKDGRKQKGSTVF